MVVKRQADQFEFQEVFSNLDGLILYLRFIKAQNGF